ncbi:MAG: RDD family protein [Nannocystaceae bacterium]
MPLRSKALRPGPCPACDGPLTAELLGGGSGRLVCPHCGLVLTPRTVAGFWRRAVAGTLDLLVLALTAGPLQRAVHWALDIDAPVRGDLSLDTALQWLALPPVTVALWMVPFLGIAAAYLVLFTALAGATLGQRALGLQVVRGDGGRPGFVRALLRVLGLAAGIAPGGLGVLWIAFDREKRGFHDHLARTYVVRGG